MILKGKEKYMRMNVEFYSQVNQTGNQWMDECLLLLFIYLIMDCLHTHLEWCSHAKF